MPLPQKLLPIAAAAAVMFCASGVLGEDRSRSDAAGSEVREQATSLGASWRVEEITGVAMFRKGAGAFSPAVIGALVPVNSDLVTGNSGSVVLVRGGDRITISPESWLRVEDRAPGLMDRFFQVLGRILYDVEPRKSRSFGVNSPLVATLVKGTTFQITTQSERAAVEVVEGRVEVTAAHETVLVDAGKTATIDVRGHDPLQVIEHDEGAAWIRASLSPPTGYLLRHPVTAISRPPARRHPAQLNTSSALHPKALRPKKAKATTRRTRRVRRVNEDATLF
jgi:ferric-dicitrate binding protein FerR (iron transport regulator)